MAQAPGLGLHQKHCGHTRPASAPTRSCLPSPLYQHTQQQQSHRHAICNVSLRGHVGLRRLQPATALKVQPPETTGQAAGIKGKSRSPLFPGPSGYGVLLVVPFLWGSYNPAVRWLYEQEHPMDPSTLTAVRTVLAAAAMGTAVAWNRLQPKNAEPEIEAAAEEDTIPAPHSMEYSAEEASNSSAGKEASASGDSIAPASPSAAAAVSVPLLARTFDGVIPAGMELGMYNFLGTSLQAIGLQLTTASRAGFLVQLTAVLVPLLASAAGIKVSKWLWAAASLALTGTCLIALDHGGSASSAAAAGGGLFNVGDLYLLTACMFYALATVRLGFYAPHHSSVELASVKKFTLCAASLAWLAASQGGSGGFSGIGTLIGQQSPVEWAVITYSALGCGALAAFLQTAGQASVPATLAQVIYSLTPLWSAFLAYLLLGDDGMGNLGWAGSAAIVVASLIATASQLGDKGKSDSPNTTAAAGTKGSEGAAEGVQQQQQPAARQGIPTMATATAAAAMAAAAVATVVVQYDPFTSIDEVDQQQAAPQVTTSTPVATPVPAGFEYDRSSGSPPPAVEPAVQSFPASPSTLQAELVPSPEDAALRPDRVEDLSAAPRSAASEIIGQASVLLGAPQPAFAEALPTLPIDQPTIPVALDIVPGAATQGVSQGMGAAAGVMQQPLLLSVEEKTDEDTLQELRSKTALLEQHLAVKQQELQQAISLVEEAVTTADATESHGVADQDGPEA